MLLTKDTYRHGAQVDPVAEQELREWAFSQPEVDHAFEDLAEFGPMKTERWEREWVRAEQEVDPNQLHHDRWLHMPEGF